MNYLTVIIIYLMTLANSVAEVSVSEMLDNIIQYGKQFEIIESPVLCIPNNPPDGIGLTFLESASNNGFNVKHVLKNSVDGINTYVMVDGERWMIVTYPVNEDDVCFQVYN